MKIIIDGNDGTGKSTLVKNLRELGYKTEDRGLPTKMTDNPNLTAPENEIYIMLDAPIEICQKRLKQAGKNLNKKYHKEDDLKYYQVKFKEVAKKLKNATLIDASESKNKTLNLALQFIEKHQ